MPNTKQYVKQGQRIIDRLGQQMDNETQGDYRVAKSALRAAGGNLSRQTSRINASSEALVAKQAASLRAIAARAKAGQRSEARGEAQAINRYGTAMSGVVDQKFSSAAAHAAAGTKVAKASAKAGQQALSTQQLVSKLGVQGVAQQQAAAKYELNQALAARNAISAETLANLTGQMYQSAMQYQMQWEMWKKQQDYAQKQAAKEASQQTHATADYLMSNGSDIQAWLSDPDNIQHTDDGSIDITKTMDAYKTAQGLDPTINPQDGTALAVAQATLRGMQNGTSPDVAIGTAVDSLYGSMPGWDKWGGSVMSTINSGAVVAVSSQTAQRVMDSTGGDPVHNSNDRDAFLTQYRQQYGDLAASQWAQQNLGWSASAAQGYLSMMPSWNFSWDAGGGNGSNDLIAQFSENTPQAYGTYGAPASTGGAMPTGGSGYTVPTSNPRGR